MSDVRKFRPRKFEQVWECECGGQKFYITKSMRLECVSCGETLIDKFVTNEQAECHKKP